MMIDVAIAIDAEAVNVTRTRAGSGGTWNENGEWEPAGPVSETIRAAIQPVKGNQLMDMPEGVRAEAGWIVWSRSEIILSDIITKGATSYRVVFAWPREDGGFFRAALGRVAT